MRLLSPRILVPAAIMLVGWGGAHLLAQSSSLAVQPATWPVAASTPSPAPTAAIPAAPGASATQPSAPNPGGGIPILPGALQKLNGDTRDTAVGLYALIQQQAALRSHLGDLVQQLEPGYRAR